jgi:uncharacterized protein YcfL
MRKVALIILFIFLLTACGANAKEYEANLQDVAEQMFNNAAEAERLLNQYSFIWQSSIEERTGIPVYSLIEGTDMTEAEIHEYFYLTSFDTVAGDFSSNINTLLVYFEDKGELSKLTELSEETKEKIQELTEPPKGYERAYEEVLDMFTFTEEYIEMALNPTGSLQTFNEEINNLSSEILSKYKRVDAVMPNK